MKSTYVYVGLVILIIIGLVVVKNVAQKGNTPTPEKLSAYDTFAQCLSDAGAKFYGAFWCPHCQAQKKLLQNSKKIPYIECSTPDKQLTPVCAAVEPKIEGYPTWVFADGSRGDGEQTLEELSKKTNCAVPQG